MKNKYKELRKITLTQKYLLQNIPNPILAKLAYKLTLTQP